VGRQQNVTPPKQYHSSITESKNTEFKTLVLKMINDIKESSNKQMNKVEKSIQDLVKKFFNLNNKFNLDEKFSKEMEIRESMEI
jgi:hypothetical protein